MTYLDAALIIVCAAVAAAGASWLLGRYVPVDTRRSHHDVGTTVFQEVGVMVSVLLAFVFSQVWGQYETAAEAINVECGALHGAAMLASAIPQGEGRPILKAITSYTGDVVRLEWSDMAHRHRSTVASDGIQIALTDAASLGSGGGDTVVKAQILSLLAQAHAARETRIFQMTQGVPAFMWFMLIGISSVLVLFVAAAGLDNPGRILFVVVFAASVSVVLVLVRMLDFPFEGALALPDSDFVKLLHEASALARAAG